MTTHPLPPTPIPAAGPVVTSPINLTPSAGDELDPIWSSIVPETRTRSNDIHLPMSLAYAERLVEAHPDADALLVRVSILLHDAGWGRVDETRILAEGFTGDWRKAAIRYEHEKQGCEIAREVLPPLGYTGDFEEKVILGKIVKATFEREVAPGQTVRFEAHLERMDPSGANTTGTITVLDHKTGRHEHVAHVELIFSHIDQNMAGTAFPEENFVFTDNFRSLLRAAGMI